VSLSREITSLLFTYTDTVSLSIVPLSYILMVISPASALIVCTTSLALVTKSFGFGTAGAGGGGGEATVSFGTGIILCATGGSASFTLSGVSAFAAGVSSGFA